ncbi:hypothetical protein PI23P_12202 [Polaribacter irgensii 23-P]|uniref:DinB-like domain-containing protein n=1 Tax=Polaribacter irgensii 23-P TaxID=313594 RepID=A4C1U3_9FLAO|nr:DinB family protein [Polaribacter irgensii]EAR12096.1 hypothetical protein PI23P_12202 [Polaribacter irgensii 23-P]
MISKTEYAPYFEQYIQLISMEEKSIIDNLESAQVAFNQLLHTVSKDKHSFSYAAGKWTLKEVIQHIIDTERIFCYRALCFARNDKTALPGYDQDLFVENDTANDRDYYELLEEMTILRKSTIQLYRSFSEAALLRAGMASNNAISVRALGYLFSGHQLHHLNIITARYL